MAKKNFKSLMIFFIFISLIGCISKQKEVKTIYFKEGKGSFQKWEEIFSSHEILKLNIPLSYHYRLLTMNSKGDYFFHIRGREGEKIIQLDFNGNFVREIAKKGEGPGEFIIPFFAICDEKDNLYIYEVTKRIIMEYDLPNYQYATQYKLKSSVSKFFIDPEGNFITFSLYNTPKLLKKYDRNGNLSKEAFKCKDEVLRAFMARFNPGGLGEVKDRGFLFIYPDKYVLYFYNYDLVLQKIYLPENFSKFYPSSPNFPPHLSPYEISSEHSEWWDQFLHMANIYFLNDRFFIVELWKSEGLSGKFYFNLHDLKGITYAKGLEVPFNGLIAYAKNGFIYVMEEEKFGKGDEIIPQKLHRYKFRGL